MQIIESPERMRERSAELKRQGRRIAFVPTMGNLHAGHLDLVEVARAEADISVVSIFVNPMQFGVGEDFGRYPRSFQGDSDKLAQAKNDILFFPPVESIYPRSIEKMTKIDVPELSSVLCGQHRPGHFVGVCTVVAKLFNIVAADVACFGEKDFQQLLIIQHMVRDLDMPVRILPVPTRRETDGLALSSRNQYLSESERPLAAQLYQSLQSIKQAVLESDEDFRAIEDRAYQQLANCGFEPDYICICDSENLQPASRSSQRMRIFAAARLGQTRLIDNIPV